MANTPFLESIASEDLGIFVNNQDFVAVQTMRERFRQDLGYRGAFGSAHPVIRSKRQADETTVSFSFVLLKKGVQKGLNRYSVLKKLSDFEVKTKKGDVIETYIGCNWTNIDIDSGLTECMVNVDISIPNF